MVRQFTIHQKVRLSGEGTVSTKHLSPDGIYEITRLMPQDQSRTFHYRIQSSAGELVMRETQLVADLPPGAAQQATISRNLSSSAPFSTRASGAPGI